VGALAHLWARWRVVISGRVVALSRLRVILPLHRRVVLLHWHVVVLAEAIASAHWLRGTTVYEIGHMSRVNRH